MGPSEEQRKGRGDRGRAEGENLERPYSPMTLVEREKYIEENESNCQLPTGQDQPINHSQKYEWGGDGWEWEGSGANLTPTQFSLYTTPEGDLRICRVLMRYS